MSELPQNATRERIMDAAERLFMSRGYNAVKLRDIADAVGMKHASLYYYVPKGKDQLFAEVVRRSMRRNNEQMKRAIAAAGDNFYVQLYAVSDWIVSQPPINLSRMSKADLPALPQEMARELESLIMISLNEPVIDVLQRALINGVASIDDIGMASMLLLTSLQGVHHVPDIHRGETRQVFGRKLVNMLLNGWLVR
ncbi:MAG: TetR/AcrR family transcriptional regulator [Candidatus Promineifilaceae bacterium]